MTVSCGLAVPSTIKASAGKHTHSLCLSDLKHKHKDTNEESTNINIAVMISSLMGNSTVSELASGLTYNVSFEHVPSDLRSHFDFRSRFLWEYFSGLRKCPEQFGLERLRHLCCLTGFSLTGHSSIQTCCGSSQLSVTALQDYVPIQTIRLCWLPAL